MDTDKPLLYELRECTLKDYSLCEYIDCSVGQHVFGISYYYDVHAS